MKNFFPYKNFSKTVSFPNTEETSSKILKDAPNILFQPIKKKRTFEEASDEIKKLIIKGVLKPGDRLPSETELARQFNVGRQTIRESLRLLELSGFITIQKGAMGGPLIVDTILNALSNSFLDSFKMKKVTIDEITVVRLEIEKVILRHVFRNISSSDIDLLQENILRAKRKIENNMGALDENVQFHKLLAKASKNQVFVIVMESIMVVVAYFLRPFDQDLEHSKRVVKAHEDILNALVEKKIDEGIDLLEKDLFNIKERLQLLNDSRINPSKE